MRAEVTYNVGASYRIKTLVFKNGITQTISDPEVINRLKHTAGFSVRILEGPKKKVRHVERRPVKEPVTVVDEVTIESTKKVREPSGSITGKKKRKG